MKKMIQNTTTWLLIICMAIGFIPAFGCVASAEGKTLQSSECVAQKTDLSSGRIYAAVRATEPAVVLAARKSAEDAEEMNTNSLFGLFLDLMKAIGLNLQSVSVDDLLKLPANVMDDVVTYFFTILKAFGVNIDSLYEKLFSVFSFK